MDVNLLSPVLASNEDRQRRERLIQDKKRKKMVLSPNQSLLKQKGDIYKTALLSNDMIRVLNELNDSDDHKSNIEEKETDEFQSMNMLRYLASLKTYQPRN